MKASIYSQLNFGEKGKIALLDSELLRQEFLVKVNDILNLFRLDDLKKLFLNVFKGVIYVFFLWVISKRVLRPSIKIIDGVKKLLLLCLFIFRWLLFGYCQNLLFCIWSSNFISCLLRNLNTIFCRISISIFHLNNLNLFRSWHTTCDFGILTRPKELIH